MLLLLIPSSFIIPSHKLVENIMLGFELLCVTNVNFRLWYRNVLLLTANIIFLFIEVISQVILCVASLLM